MLQMNWIRTNFNHAVKYEARSTWKAFDVFGAPDPQQQKSLQIRTNMEFCLNIKTGPSTL